jgi:hypothetical protein
VIVNMHGRTTIKTITKVLVFTGSSNVLTVMVLFQVTLMSIARQLLLLETKKGSSPAAQQVISRTRRDGLTGLHACVTCKTKWHLCTPNAGRRLYKGVLYFRKVKRFHDTRVGLNVILLTPTTSIWSSLGRTPHEK